MDPHGAHLALVLSRANGQHGAPEGGEERGTLLQDTVQGAGTAPEVPCAYAPWDLWEKGAGADAAGAPPSPSPATGTVLQGSSPKSPKSAPAPGSSLVCLQPRSRRSRWQSPACCGPPAHPARPVPPFLCWTARVLGVSGMSTHGPAPSPRGCVAPGNGRCPGAQQHEPPPVPCSSSLEGWPYTAL